MNCEICNDDNLRDFPLCKKCETLRHYSNRVDCKCMPCQCIDYREAARLMNQPKDYYRIKNADGSYKHFDSIERWQPRGKGTRLYVKRADVQAWIEATRTPVQVQVKQKSVTLGYESAAATARRLGATGTMKSFDMK